MSTESKLLFAVVLGAPAGVMLGGWLLHGRQRVLDLANSDRVFYGVIGVYTAIALACYAGLGVAPSGFVDGYYDRAVKLLHEGVYGGDSGAAALYPPSGQAFYPPGYSLLLYGGMVLLGEGIHTVFLLNLSMFLAMAYLLRLALRRTGVQHHNAYTLVLFFSLGRFFFHFIPVSDAMGAYWATASLVVMALALQAQPPNVFFAFVSGLLLGWDILTRINAALYLAPLVIIVVGASIYSRLRLALLPAILVGAVLPVGAWSLRNYAVFHEPFIVTTNGGYNLFHGNNDQSGVLWIDQDEQIESETNRMTEVQRDRYLSDQAVAWIRQHPSRFTVLAAEKLARAFGSDTAAISILENEMAEGRTNAVPDAVLAASYFLANCVYYALIVLFLERWWRLLRRARDHMLEIGATLLLSAATALPVALTFGFARYRDFFFYIMVMSVAGLLGRIGWAQQTHAPACYAMASSSRPQ